MLFRGSDTRGILDAPANLDGDLDGDLGGDLGGDLAGDGGGDLFVL